VRGAIRVFGVRSTTAQIPAKNGFFAQRETKVGRCSCTARNGTFL